MTEEILTEDTFTNGIKEMLTEGMLIEDMMTEDMWTKDTFIGDIKEMLTEDMLIKNMLTEDLLTDAMVTDERVTGEVLIDEVLLSHRYPSFKVDAVMLTNGAEGIASDFPNDRCLPMRGGECEFSGDSRQDIPLGWLVNLLHRTDMGSN